MKKKRDTDDSDTDKTRQAQNEKLRAAQRKAQALASSHSTRDAKEAAPVGTAREAGPDISVTQRSDSKLGSLNDVATSQKANLTVSSESSPPGRSSPTLPGAAGARAEPSEHRAPICRAPAIEKRNAWKQPCVQYRDSGFLSLIVRVYKR